MQMVCRLSFDNSLGIPACTPTKEKIVSNHKSLLCSFGISTKDEELDLLSLYWIPTITSVSIQKVILLDLVYQQSKPGFIGNVQVSTLGMNGENIKCGF